MLKVAMRRVLALLGKGAVFGFGICATFAIAQQFQLPNNSIVIGHFLASQPGGPPVASLCGAAVDAGSSDTGGSIVNIGTTTCTITFGTPYLNKPSCVVHDQTANPTFTAVVTTASIVITGGVAANAYAWICMGKSAA